MSWYAWRKQWGMTRKFLTAVLVVAAFGCARSASTPNAPVAATTATTMKTKTVAVAKPRELRPVGVAKELTPTTRPEPGVALHGPEKTYLEQVDNSGWGGRSPEPPTAVGGGPAAESSELKTDTDEQSEEK